MKLTLTLLTALLLTPLVAALAQPAQAAGPAAEENARLLALVEPRMKAIYTEFWWENSGDAIPISGK